MTDATAAPLQDTSLTRDTAFSRAAADVTPTAELLRTPEGNLTSADLAERLSVLRTRLERPVSYPERDADQRHLADLDQIHQAHTAHDMTDAQLQQAYDHARQQLDTADRQSDQDHIRAALRALDPLQHELQQRAQDRAEQQDTASTPTDDDIPDRRPPSWVSISADRAYNAIHDASGNSETGKFIGGIVGGIVSGAIHLGAEIPMRFVDLGVLTYHLYHDPTTFREDQHLYASDLYAQMAVAATDQQRALIVAKDAIVSLAMLNPAIGAAALVDQLLNAALSGDPRAIGEALTPLAVAAIAHEPNRTTETTRPGTDPTPNPEREPVTHNTRFRYQPANDNMTLHEPSPTVRAVGAEGVNTPPDVSANAVQVPERSEAEATLASDRKRTGHEGCGSQRGPRPKKPGPDIHPDDGLPGRLHEGTTWEFNPNTRLLEERVVNDRSLISEVQTFRSPEEGRVGLENGLRESGRWSQDECDDAFPLTLFNETTARPIPSRPDTTHHLGYVDKHGNYRGTVWRNVHVADGTRTTYYVYSIGDH